MTWLARALAGSLVLVFFASSASAAPPSEGEATSQSIVEIDVERREVLYVAGMRIPKDAVVVKRRRWELVGAGGASFAVFYFATLGFSLNQPYRSSEPTPMTVNIPVVGPFLVRAQGYGDGDHAPGRVPGLAVSGLHQLLGVTVMIVGLAFPKTRVYVSDSPRRSLSLTVLPVASRESQGLSLLARF